MIELVDIDAPLTLDDYESVAQLSGTVRDLRSEAATLVESLRGRKVWMVNSTAAGGGVAEMLPRMIKMLRELGVEAQWAVIGTDKQPFFGLTKRIHNLIHGVPQSELTAEDRELYEAVSRENADDLRRHLSADDILVIHDPQPMGMGAILKEELQLPTIWRCHIGLDQMSDATYMVWRFLKPYAHDYDHAVFSAPEYIPGFFAGRASVIHPAIDPLSHKNRRLSPHKLMGILCNASLAVAHSPVLTPSFEQRARRLMPDGTWGPPCSQESIGVVYRPIVSQISRWDRLKGFLPLMKAFIRLKGRKGDAENSERHRRRLEIVRLMMAGPDPASIQDDPEGLEVLKELSDAYLGLPAELQRDIAFLTLPMQSHKENALMVNAIQRCSTVVVQNSLQEGFGLTVTEAMWKHTPVLGSKACGVRQQIRDGLDGKLSDHAEDHDGIAAILDDLLDDDAARAELGRNGQRRVHEEFLVFSQMRKWLHTLVDTVTREPVRKPAA